MLGRGFLRAALWVAIGTRKEGPVPAAAMDWGFCTRILTGSQAVNTPNQGLLKAVFHSHPWKIPVVASYPIFRWIPDHA